MARRAFATLGQRHGCERLPSRLLLAGQSTDWQRNLCGLLGWLRRLLLLRYYAVKPVSNDLGYQGHTRHRCQGSGYPVGPDPLASMSPTASCAVGTWVAAPPTPPHVQDPQPPSA